MPELVYTKRLGLLIKHVRMYGASEFTAKTCGKPSMVWMR